MTKRAIIKINVISKNGFLVNYSRRMYALLRNYTPEAKEGGRNECYADITGLRTFYKKTYNELIAVIVSDIEKEIGVVCSVHSVSSLEYENIKNISSKKHKEISTYKEMNNLFTKSLYVPTQSQEKTIIRKKIRLSVPFLGKVA